MQTNTRRYSANEPRPPLNPELRAEYIARGVLTPVSEDGLTPMRRAHGLPVLAIGTMYPRMRWDSDMDKAERDESKRMERV